MGGRTRVAIGAVVVAAGALMRWAILTSGAGWMNADEMVTGLGAIDALRGRFDVVIPGGAYTANFESYLFAPVYAVLGPRILPLKLMAVMLWGFASLLTYRSLRPGLGDATALGAGAAAWLIPGALLVLSTQSYLAYAGGFVLIGAAVGRLVRLLEAAEPTVRLSAWAGWWCGLAIYAHPMYVATLSPIVAAVAWQHRTEFRRWWRPAGLCAAAANLPWIAWNIRHGLPSLKAQTPAGEYSYLDRLGRFFTGLLPRDFGLLDPDGGRWLFGRSLSVALYLVLLAALVGGVVAMARAGRSGKVLAAGALVVWPLMAVFANLGYVRDGRYGIVAVPYLVAALGAAAVSAIRGLEWLARRACRPRISRVVGAVTLLAAWLGVVILPYLARFTGRGTDPNRATLDMVSRLESSGVRYVAGSYWAVLPMTYLSDARIASAVTARFPVRYPQYQREVEAADPAQVVFLFAPWDDDPGSLWLPRDRYERTEHPGFIVYRPIGTN